MNGSGRSACRARFGIAHELGHFALHVGVLTGDRLTETQANRFASAFLLPRTSFMAEGHIALRWSCLSWEGLRELKKRWGVSKAAILYRGSQFGMFTSEQMRASYIHLKRRGEAIEEHEDHEMEIDSPEVVPEGLRVLTEDLGISLPALAHEMFVQSRLLKGLLGMAPDTSTSNVVQLFGSA